MCSFEFYGCTFLLSHAHFFCSLFLPFPFLHSCELQQNLDSLHLRGIVCVKQHWFISNILYHWWKCGLQVMVCLDFWTRIWVSRFLLQYALEYILQLLVRACFICVVRENKISFLYCVIRSFSYFPLAFPLKYFQFLQLFLLPFSLIFSTSFDTQKCTISKISTRVIQSLFL